jgi:hypothetical protein
MVTIEGLARTGLLSEQERVGYVYSMLLEPNDDTHFDVRLPAPGVGLPDILLSFYVVPC